MAKKAYELGPPRCSSFPTGFVTADFRVGFFNVQGQQVAWRSVGVLAYNMNGYDMNGNPNDAAFWGTGCSASSTECAVLLHGNKLSLLGRPNIPALTSSYQSYSIDYKALFQAASQYVTLPSGFTWNDAVPTGFDVYISVRGANLDFVVKNADVWGQ